MLMFGLAIGGFGLVQQQFFPTSTRTELFFEMRLPEGTAIGVTDATAKKAEQLLVDDPDIVTCTSYVGQGAPRFWLGLNPVLPDSNFATSPAKVKDLWYQVRKKVGDIKNELPAGITGPNFNDEFGDVYSALYMLTADGLNFAALKDRAEDIRQRLLRVPDVNKVDIIGERPQKIFIKFSHAKLATLCTSSAVAPGQPTPITMTLMVKFGSSARPRLR
jgi:multidrug efflux pump